MVAPPRSTGDDRGPSQAGHPPAEKLEAGRGSPHDEFFKESFQSAEHAASLLSSALSPELSRRVDWSTLVPAPTEHIDEWLVKRYSDVFFRARLFGDDTRWVYFDVLLEHQSESQLMMSLRMLGMIVRRYEALLRDDPGLKRLPIVLPVVLYQGEGPRSWRHPVQLSQLLDCDLETLEAFRALIPDFRFVLDDLSQQSLDALFSRALTDVARLTLRLLRDARWVPDFMRSLENPRDLELWRKIATTANGAMVYQRFWVYLYRTVDVPNEQIHQFARKLGQAAEESQMTALQRLIEQISPQIKAEGEAKGKLEGKAELLVRLLTLKFGALPDAARSRVENASEDELFTWSERILTATTLDDVLGS